MQEAKRVAALAQAEINGEKERQRRRVENSEKKKKYSSWSERVEKKDEKDKRKDKRKLKAKWLKSQAAVQEEPTTTGKRQREEVEEASGVDNEEDDWDSLAREEKMAKRLRKGDISQKAFDAEFTDLTTLS